MLYRFFATHKIPFWDKNSVDKPSGDFFKKEFEDSTIWTELGRITPNYISQFNATITIDDMQYNYFKLESDNSYPIYFLVDSKNKILNKGVVVNLTVDMWATYIIHILKNPDYLYQVPIFINRTTFKHIIKKNYAWIAQQQDELAKTPTGVVSLGRFIFDRPQKIDNKNAEYAGSNQYRFNYYETEALDRWDWRSGGDWGRINTMVKYAGGDFSRLSCAYFEVFQDINGDFYYFPIFKIAGAINWEIEGGGTSYFCNNTLQVVERLKNRNYWTNKYVGRHFLPGWSAIIDKFNYVVVKIDNSDFIGGFYHRNGYLKIFNKTDLGGFSFAFEELTTKLDLKSDGKIPILFLKDYKNTNNNVIGYYADDGRIDKTYFLKPINFGDTYEWVYQFIAIKGMQTYIINGSNQYANISGFETMPTNTNSYNNYIAGVMNQQNTGLQLAKQQSIYKGIMGGLSNLADIYGATGNVKLDDPSSVVKATTQGFKGLLGIVGNIAGNILQYQNQEKQKRAFEADLMNKSTAHNYMSSNQQADLLNSALNTNTEGWSASPVIHNLIYNFDKLSCLGYTNLNELNNNKYIYLNYGFQLNKYYYFDLWEFWPENNGLDFIYVDWNIEYSIFKTKLMEYFLSYGVDPETLKAAHLCFNQPFRIWAKTPDYTIDNYCLDFGD